MAADDRVPILGLSDPLNFPTGFGAVARGLFTRLPQDRFRLGYLSQWVGSRQFPGLTCYGAPGARFGADAFPQVALDWGGRGGRFVLWSLLDPWMTSWISHPEQSPIRTPNTIRFFRDGGRKRFVWVGHFPIDGLGPREGPGRWIEGYVDAMDIPVAMSEWGRRVLQPWTKKAVRLVSHAASDGFRPMDRAQAREEVDFAMFRGMLAGLALLKDLGPDEKVSLELAAEARSRAFRVGDGFTVVCVMANRTRKYWADVLRAFALLAQDVPDARLIGVCGDRKGEGDDMWPLEDIARELGLRLDSESEDPNVCLIEHVEDRPDAEPDYSMRLLYAAADVAVLLSGGEGFGLPQLEAHACGLPCFVGDYTASTELAVDRRELLQPRTFTETPSNQVRRPVYDPRELAKRLKWAAANPAWRREAGLAGAAQADNRRWGRILPLWLDIFAEAGALIGQDREGKPDAPEPAGAPAPVPAPA